MQLAAVGSQCATAPQTSAAATTSEDTRSAVMHAVYEGLLDGVRSIATAAAQDASLLPQLLGACCTFALCASAVAAAGAKATSASSGASLNDWRPAALNSGKRLSYSHSKGASVLHLNGLCICVDPSMQAF